MKQPQHYPKRTLFAVVGMTPQIITESLYALAVKQQPAFIPTDIKIITTKLGAEQVRLNLLSESPGWFSRFCRDYGLSDIQFTEDDIQVLSYQDGTILEDIRELEDNKLMADAITEKIRELTSDEDRAVHVSIAGGRKTMGYYAGYALSLFGREQDRLSHVLVDAPYESLHKFYYPTPYSKVIPIDPKRSVDTANATVTLAEIPFVSLRHGLPKKLSEGKASFSNTVQVAKKVMGPVDIVFDRVAGTLKCAEQSINLPPRDYAFYLWMATRKKNNLPPIRGSDEDTGIAKEYLAIYEEKAGSFSGRLETIKKTMRCSGQDQSIAEEDIKYFMDAEFIEQRMSTIKKELFNALGEGNIEGYFFNRLGKKPNTHVEFAASSDEIHFN